MTRIGVLDIGSNSVKLQIIDARPGGPPLPTETLDFDVKLAERAERGGRIGDRRVAETVSALREALDVSERKGIAELIAFGTAALRDAPNGADIRHQLERVTGVPVQLLSGSDEARLAYLAVHRWFGWARTPLLVADIGGGSTEVAHGRDEEPEVAISIPVGAGSLTRRYLADDPPTRQQVRGLRRECRQALRDIEERLCWEREAATAVGTSKTFRQLARLCGAAPRRDGPFVTRSLEIRTLERATDKLLAMTEARRAQARGVSKKRARQVVAGAVLAVELMRSLHVQEVSVSPWALREGILLRRLDMLRDDDERHDHAIIQEATSHPVSA